MEKRMELLSRPRSVKAYPLRNEKLKGWEETITGRWTYSDLVADPAWFNGWISFDALRWNPYTKKLYCGLNSLDGDLLFAFDPQFSRFESLNSRQWTEKYDVKIHRTLLLNPADRCLYMATSLLHDLDRQQEAKGGKLVKVDPVTGAYQVLSVPVPSLYIQSIAADWERNILYGFTYPAEAVFRFDIATGTSRILGYIGNAIMFAQPHNSVVDRDGWLWGTWAETRAWEEQVGQDPIRLFKYHPEGDRFVWFGHGLSRKDTGKELLTCTPRISHVSGPMQETRHKDDFGFCDSMTYDGGRYIYAGTVAGVLCRIDIVSGEVEKLVNVIPAGRFPALAIKDGVLYGAGGLQGKTQLIRWNISGDRVECFADLEDQKVRTRPARIHEMAVDEEHRIYMGENDNHHRSSYLWIARLD
jgi:hypothetical protein